MMEAFVSMIDKFQIIVDRVLFVFGIVNVLFGLMIFGSE